MTTALVELFKHNLWANLRLIEVCALLDEARLDASVPGTYGSVRDTLVHLVAAEGRYVALLNDRQPDPGFDERTSFPGWDELRERARQSGEGLVASAQDLDAARILRGVRHDQAYELPVVVPIVQAINHATEHRVHVATILTQQGIEPPSLDGWHYNDEVLGAG